MSKGTPIAEHPSTIGPGSHSQTDKPWKGNPEKEQRDDDAELDLEKWKNQHPIRRRLPPKEDVMPKDKRPLEPNDFPVNADGKKIKKEDGTPVANTDDPAVAADIAERLNDDEARREEDKWSA